MSRLVISTVRQILGAVLQLGPRTASLTATTPLLGNLPELDSLAAAMLLTELETSFGFTVMDDMVSGEDFATLGSLARFVERQQGAARADDA